MKKALPGLLALILVSGASGLDSTIATSCPGDYEPVISMSDPSETFNNPGYPGRYSYKLCVQGITESSIGTSCSRNTGFYISSNTTEAHFSKFESYNLHVCTAEMLTAVRDTCLANQTALMSVSSTHNAHVAGPGVLDKQLCGYLDFTAENVSVSLEFNLSSSDQVFIDGSAAGKEKVSIAEYPYITAEAGGNVAGLVAADALELERGLENRNTLVMVRESSEASFIVPFTREDHQTIEDHQEQVLENRFLTQLSPSFSFFIPLRPTVKTVLLRDTQLDSQLELGAGTYTIEISKTGENTVRIRER